VILRDEIRKLDTFKRAHSHNIITEADTEKFLEQCRDESPFLYNNYMDIFHRFVKDELDLEIMTKLLIVLKLIEDEKVDQNEGSVMVGKVLKELYVDSALKQSQHLDAANPGANTPLMPVPVNPISWKDYKLMKGM
jgi:hypothetical protein